MAKNFTIHTTCIHLFCISHGDDFTFYQIMNVSNIKYLGNYLTREETAGELILEVNKKSKLRSS